MDAPDQRDIAAVSALIESGRYDEAESRAVEITRRFPRDAEAWKALGIAAFSGGRSETAVAALSTATALAPDDVLVLHNLGAAQRSLGRLDEAEAACRRVLALAPDDADAHNNLGVVLDDLGRIEEATAHFRRAFAAGLFVAGFHLGVASLYRHHGAADEARRALEMTASTDPAHWMSLVSAVYLAVLSFLDGDRQKARAWLQAAQKAGEPAAAVDANTRNTHVYWRYLNALLAHPPVLGTGEVLYVVGDSHALALSGLTVNERDRWRRCAVRWLLGCKQWHLAQPGDNKYKAKFVATLDALPARASVLLTFGEIDCRSNSGIFPFWAKTRRRDIKDIAMDTLRGYLDFVERYAAPRSLSVIISGVPAITVRSLVDLAKADHAGFIGMVKYFNAALKEQALARGFGFLDVHGLTDRGDGVSDDIWHMDEHHLVPEAYVEAFRSRRA